MGFLYNEDYEELPNDDGAAFAHLEAISRQRLYATERGRDDDITWEEMLRYMNEITAIAHEFAIPDISYDYQADNTVIEFARFTRSVDYRLAQIRVQGARRARNHSVAITDPARVKIQHHLERLKEEVTNSDIPEKRKQALLDKIAEFESELAKRRINLAAVMTVVALVSSVVHDNTETLLEGPKIVQAISVLLGKAHTEEEEQNPRLSGPSTFKAIPDMRAKSEPQNQTRKSFGFDEGLTDDVPF